MINVTIRVPTGHSINVPRGTRDAVIEFLRERGAKRGNYSLITTGAAKGTHRRKEAGVSVLSGNAAVKIVVQPGSNNTSREYAFTAHPYDNDDELRKLLLSPPKVSTTEGSNHITAVELLSNQDAQMCIAEALGDSLSEQDVAVAIQLAAEGLGRSINAQELAVASKIVMTQLTKAKSADQAAHEPIEAESSSDGRDPAWVEFVGKRGTIRGEDYKSELFKKFGETVFSGTDIFEFYAEHVKYTFGSDTPRVSDYQMRFIVGLHTKAGLVVRIDRQQSLYRLVTKQLLADVAGLNDLATVGRVTALGVGKNPSPATGSITLKQQLDLLNAKMTVLRAEISERDRQIELLEKKVANLQADQKQSIEQLNVVGDAASKVNAAIAAVSAADKAVQQLD